MVTEANLREEEEIFHSEYRVFLHALEFLAASPEQQCQKMGDYNVAWELREDVSAGKYLVGRGYLSSEQEAWVMALVGAVKEVPAQVLPAGAGRDRNLAAMLHPSWLPLRSFAASTLDALREFTSQNAKYLGLESGSAI